MAGKKRLPPERHVGGWFRVHLGGDNWAIVDEVDLPLAMAHFWCLNLHRGGRPHRVIRNGIGERRLHRAIMRAEVGTIVDHINGDVLDNRRCNLRVCNNAENQRNRGPNKNNTSGYKGVTFHKAAGRWAARIMHDGRKCLYLGLFDTPEDAARAYNEAAVRLHGAFARPTLVQ